MTSASPPVPTHASETALATLRLALWFGLLAGIGEVVLIAARKYLLHHLVFVGKDVVWMAPLADALLFVVAAILLIGLRAVLPRRLRPPAILVFAALATFTLLLMYEPLYRPAAALLAIGVGMVVLRMARRWSAAFDRTVRWTLPVLVIGVVAAGAVRVQAAGSAGSERPGAATARADAPDILFIVLDTVRAWNLSVYGYPRPTTPEIERWMRDGVRFEHALSTAPWTLASHATMFTGRYPHELSVDWLTALDATYPTLAEVLSAQGYATAGFVGNMFYCSYETGLARGFSHYEDYPITATHVLRDSSLGRLVSGTRFERRKVLRKSAETVNADFLAWLKDRQDARPYFVFLNYMDAHEPYQPPAPFDELYSKPGDAALIRDLTDAAAAPHLTPEVRQALVVKYDESITYIDNQLGRLFTELKRRGRWDNTLVVITADHGEELGERGFYFHGNTLYRGSLEVPLLLRLPGVVPAGRSIGAQVSLKDLAATVLALAGARAELPGRSLARYWDGGVAEPAGADDALLMELHYYPRLPKDAPIAKGSMKAVLQNSMKLIRNGDGSEELYDFANDRTDSVDLAGAPEHEAELKALRKTLETLAVSASPMPAHAGSASSTTPLVR